MRTAIDLFAGLGGATLGAEQAGMKVIYAANHWAVAVQVHRSNHPLTQHEVQDLRQADFTKLPAFDLLWASPCCQGHSKARGKERPHHDAARCSAYSVFECTSAKLPPCVIVENVKELQSWGTESKPGIFYQRWRDNFEDLGYSITENFIDAATLGVPQVRNRLFIVMVHESTGKKAPVVKNGTCKPIPAREIMEWNGKHKWSPTHKAGRSKNTLRQIELGKSIHGTQFLVEYYGNAHGGRSLNRPIGTITCKDRYALVDGNWMRMLTKEEYRRAQGFPSSYILPEDHRLAVQMIGNSVVPAVAKHVIQAVKAA